jgi:hypothetical protein
MSTGWTFADLVIATVVSAFDLFAHLKDASDAGTLGRKANVGYSEPWPRLEPVTAPPIAKTPFVFYSTSRSVTRCSH